MKPLSIPFALLFSGGCTLASGGSSSSGGPAAGGAAEEDVGVAPSCAVAGEAALRAPHGRVLSVATADGGATLLAAQVVLADGGVRLAQQWDVALERDGADCLALNGEGQPAFTAVPLGHTYLPTSAVDTPAGTWLYFQDSAADPTAPFGVRTDGYGVALRQGGAARFEPSAQLLWTADRPTFGQAAILHQGKIYVFGCSGYGFLQAHCSVARVEEARAADESAYEYYVGAGRFTGGADNAWPLVEAGTSMAVYLDGARQRWVMVYTHPLGQVLYARTGLSPSGPWSAEHAWARCQLPAEDPEAFCADAAVHTPFHWSAGGEPAVTYAVRSLVPRAPPEAYITRLMRVALPEGLP